MSSADAAALAALVCSLVLVVSGVLRIIRAVREARRRALVQQWRADVAMAEAMRGVKRDAWEHVR